MTKPQASEYPPYAASYVSQIRDDENPLAFLEEQAVWELLHSLSEEESNYRYADSKWSIKELLGHMIDTERIFAYRALCIARGEKQNLPGFDENTYVDVARFEQRTFESLLAEYTAVREATLFLFEHCDEAALSQTGTTNNNPTSARAILYIMAGHERHHISILNERYLSTLKNSQAE